MKSIGQFLNELEDELKYLNPKDRSEVIKHYRNKINTAMDYGDTEQKIMATLPTPQKIAEEIYHSKGITYLEKKKKEYKRNQIVKSIFSGLLILILLSAFLCISYFFGRFVVNLFKLCFYSFSFFNIIDTGSLILFNLSYSFILMIGYIYVFDLCYIMVMHFLQIILDCVTKEIRDYPFTEFTVSGWIQKHVKVKKFLPNLLLGFVCGVLVFGVISYSTKGYIYRSMNNTIQANKKMEITEEIDTIRILENSSFIEITSSDTVQHVVILYGSEFEEELKHDIADGVFTIHPMKSKTFDPLGLLDEPRQKLKLILPKQSNTKQITIHFNDGILDIVDVNASLDLDINGSHFTAAFTRTTLHSLSIEGLNMNLALEDNTIQQCNVKMQSGRFCAVGDTYQGFSLQNYLGDIILQKISFDSATIENMSGKAAIDKLDTNQLLYKSIRSQDNFQDNRFEQFRLQANTGANIQILRLVVLEDFDIEEDAGYVSINGCKAKTIHVSGKSTSNSLYHIGTDVAVDGYEGEMKEYVDRYNQFTEMPSIHVETSSGSIVLQDSALTSANFNLQKTSLTVNTSNIEYTHLTANEASVNLLDLDGKTVFANTKKGGFIFYNENIPHSSITLTLESDGTSLDIDKNIKTTENK